MRRWMCGSLILFAVAPTATAAPVPGQLASQRPVPPAVREEAQAFGQRVLQIADAVAEQYVREVKRSELLAAAVAGLYEAARVPLPASLLRDLEGARTADDLMVVLCQAREQLGEAKELGRDDAVLAACRGIAGRLDKHSGVVTGEDLRRGIGVDEQNGFGLEVAGGLKSPFPVLTVSPGGPAQKAGLRPGDEITTVTAKQWDGSLQVESISGLLNSGDPGVQLAMAPLSRVASLDEVEITFVRRHPRGEAQERTVTLQRENFQPETVLGTVRRDDNSWNFWLDPKRKIAHVRISGFGNTTALDLRNALDELTQQGLRGLILDVAVATGRTEEDTRYKNLAEKTYRDFPLVVLVNGETTGGAELIAAAVQDYKRGAVAGSRTAGKGNIQVHLPLGPDAGFKLTTRTLLRPSKKNLHRFPDSGPDDDWGVRPDDGLEVRVSADLDKQLKEWWLLQTLRPGGCRERLPLDDPEADPQRQAALEELLKQIKN